MSGSDPHWVTGKAPTREEILAELARELAMRRNLYPKWVAAGKLKQPAADLQVDRMQAAHDWIRAQTPSPPERSAPT